MFSKNIFGRIHLAEWADHFSTDSLENPVHQPRRVRNTPFRLLPFSEFCLIAVQGIADGFRCWIINSSPNNMGEEMPGSNKFIDYGGPGPRSAENYWEVLERGGVDTYPLHTALWLFKNAQGGTAPFLPYRGRLSATAFGTARRDTSGPTIASTRWRRCPGSYACPPSGWDTCKRARRLRSTEASRKACPIRRPRYLFIVTNCL